MNIFKILSSPLINKTQLAKEMYKKNKTAETYLNKKINNIQGQSIGPKDKAKIIEIINNLIND